jgi:hypothetical protein
LARASFEVAATFCTTVTFGLASMYSWRSSSVYPKSLNVATESSIFSPPSFDPEPAGAQPEAMMAMDAAPATAAIALVRRESFTVTPLCVWFG